MIKQTFYLLNFLNLNFIYIYSEYISKEICNSLNF